MIVLERVSKSFDGVWAVRGLDLHVRSGEVFGFLGPNAAGKTTTIRMMAGLLKPTEGRILLKGYDIVREPLKAKTIMGYVPDKVYLYEKLTAREFLLFIASLHGLKKVQAFKRIDELVSIFGIKEIEEELIERFSQGMRQRLLFLSALIHNPQILLIDEPFVGLDPYGVMMFKDSIRRLRSEGVSIFLATHSLHIAEDLCTRVGLIHKGSLITIKNKEEIAAGGGLEGLFLKITSDSS